MHNTNKRFVVGSLNSPAVDFDVVVDLIAALAPENEIVGVLLDRLDAMAVGDIEAFPNVGPAVRVKDRPRG